MFLKDDELRDLTILYTSIFENLNLKRYLIPVKPAQIEAVKIINDTEFCITSESEAKGTPRLFHLKLKRPE